MMLLSRSMPTTLTRPLNVPEGTAAIPLDVMSRICSPPAVQS